MGLQSSPLIKSTQHSTLSPDGRYVATVTPSRLQIRSVTSSEILRNIPIQSDSSLRAPQWSPISDTHCNSQRVLVSDDDAVRVWDLHDHRWSTKIGNGSGGMGKIVHAAFANTEDAVLVVSDFCSRIVFWCLKTRLSVEIKDPKFATKGACFHPQNGALALLSRPGPQDVLTLHARSSYAVLKTVVLPTVDAQGMKWSREGRWLVVWEAASAGSKAYIYTMDGHLYRTYAGDGGGGSLGLGIKSVEWSPRADYLAIGTFDNRVTLLSTRTFSPVVYLDHTPTIQLPTGAVWQEHASASSRTYAPAVQPASPPSVQSSANEFPPKMGVSIASFSPDGSMLATRDDAHPTTVWLWDLTKMIPKAVLLQHSSIKSIQWHPDCAGLLLIICNSADSEPVLHIWQTLDEPYVPPQILTLPKGTFTSKPSTLTKLDARWLPKWSDKIPGIFVGDSQNSLLVWPEGKDEFPAEADAPRATTPEQDEVEDSLFDILSGRVPTPRVGANGPVLGDDQDDSLEDTFHGRHNLVAT